MRSGRADALQGSDDVVVRVAIVDLEGEIVLFGDLDVRLERAELRVTPGFVGAEEVEPRLADGAHPRPARELGDHLEGVVELSAGLVVGRVVRVDRDGCEHPRFDGRHVGGPARRLDVVADLDDTAHADARRTVELLPVVERIVAVRDLQVRVVVVHAHHERLRQRRVGQIAAVRRVPVTDVGLVRQRSLRFGGTALRAR